MREVLDWQEYFMTIAKAVSQRSKDPNTQVGAIIVDRDKHIVSTGYNGFSPGFEDNQVRWSKKLKYDYVIHAEMNAILHATRSVKECSLYVTMFPCKDCAKHIVSAGIKEIFYLDDKYFNEVSKKLFLECGVKYTKLEML